MTTLACSDLSDLRSGVQFFVTLLSRRPVACRLHLPGAVPGSDTLLADTISVQVSLR